VSRDRAARPAREHDDPTEQAVRRLPPLLTARAPAVLSSLRDVTLDERSSGAPVHYPLQRYKREMGTASYRDLLAQLLGVAKSSEFVQHPASA